MKVKRKLFLLLALASLFQAAFVCSLAQNKSEKRQSLKLQVKGFETLDGVIKIAVYNNADSFLKKAIFVKSIPSDSIAKAPLDISWPVGVYAVSLYQDANNNGRLDTGTFGIPVEKYGFSNDAEGFMGPPSFKSCAFNLDRDSIITITLK